GEFVLEFVVVRDDEFDAELPSFLGLLDGGDAAVDGDDEPDSGRGELADLLDVQAVAFADAERDVELDVRLQPREKLHEDGGARDAVSVVVAVDADLPPGGSGPRDPLRGLGDAGQ